MAECVKEGNCEVPGVEEQELHGHHVLEAPALILFRNTTTYKDCRIHPASLRHEVVCTYRRSIQIQCE